MNRVEEAVAFLYYMVGNWNSWFNAMALLKEVLAINHSTMFSVGSAGGVSINSVKGVYIGSIKG
ncbi:MAG: hypothetical protein H9893_02740 [Candidatus Niameybacter stercoravium]|nr:hypothetical protein [Candidatus Niameybacter stercoravium]